MALTGRLQMRLKPDIEKYIDRRVSELGGSRSDYIMLLIAKDKETNVEDKRFWVDAVDAQIDQLNKIMRELQAVKKGLVG